MLAPLRLLLLGLGMAIAAGVPALAQSVEEFYAGRQIDLLVGFGPGGGYDTHARVLARHLGRHIPGNPAIVPRNRPGAGSLVLANELFTTLPRDGTAIAVVSRGILHESILGSLEVEFDPRTASWIGSTAEELAVCFVWHEAPIATWRDLVSRGMIAGSTGQGSSTTNISNALNNLFGMRLKQIAGYTGSSEVLLAMERGEVEGRCGESYSSLVSRRPDLLEDGKLRILLQLSDKRHPDLSGVPGLMALAPGQDNLQILSPILLPQKVGRPFVGPPQIPADRLAALRAAFDATMIDPEYVADIERQRLDLSPRSGEEVERLVTGVHDMSSDLIEAVRRAMSGSGDVEIIDRPGVR